MQERGIPVVALLVAVVLVVWSYVATKTRYGRHIYAVGGNKEASRRAGIDTDWIRITGFVIGSTMAALGGVILASRLQSVDTEAGGSVTYREIKAQPKISRVIAEAPVLRAAARKRRT